MILRNDTNGNFFAYGFTQLFSQRQRSPITNEIEKSSLDSGNGGSGSFSSSRNFGKNKNCRLNLTFKFLH